MASLHSFGGIKFRRIADCPFGAGFGGEFTEGLLAVRKLSIPQCLIREFLKKPLRDAVLFLGRQGGEFGYQGVEHFGRVPKLAEDPRKDGHR